MEILYKDYITFNILEDKLNIISNETDYGRSTVAELNGKYYYLGDEPPDLESAIFIWQDMRNRALTLTEIAEIIKANIDLELKS